MTRSREKDDLVGQGQASLIELSSVDTGDSHRGMQIWVWKVLEGVCQICIFNNSLWLWWQNLKGYEG